MKQFMQLNGFDSAHFALCVMLVEFDIWDLTPKCARYAVQSKFKFSWLRMVW